MIRSPFLSLEQAENYCKSEHHLLGVLKDPIVSQAIRASSPVLFEKLKSLLQAANPDPDLLQSLFNTINRMTYRSVPFACYAGVAFGRIRPDAESVIQFLPQENYKLWADLPDPQKPAPKSTSKKLALNPTLYFNRNVAQFIRRISPRQTTYQFSFVELPQPLIEQLNQDPNKLDPQTLELLRELDILWPRSFVKQDAANTGFLHELARAPLVVAGERPPLPLRKELTKPTVESLLSEKSVQILLKGAELLFSIFGESEFQTFGIRNLESIRDDFQSLFHYQEIPLLELLNPNHVLGQKFISKCFENKRLNQPRLNEFLDALLLQYQENPSDPVQLDFHKVQVTKRRIGMKENKSSFDPTSFSLVASAVRDGDEKIKFLLKYIKGPQPASHFVRYISVDDRIKSHIETLLDWEKKQHPGIILAEILHSADRERVNPISPQLGFHEAAIPVSIGSSKSDVTEIPLADLQVFYSEGRFRLRSRQLNQEVLPVLTNLHAIYVDSNPIYQFLAELHIQNSFLELSWKWGQLRLASFPRIEMGSVILSPAIWRLGLSALKNMKDSNPELAKEILSRKGVPKTFYCLDKDNTSHHVNVDNPLSFRSFLNQIQDRDVILLQEAFEPALSTGPEGRYHHDFVIPFGRQAPLAPTVRPYPFSKVAQKPVSRKERTLPPGSDWTYLQIYIDPIHYSHFLREHLGNLVQSPRSDWFFLPYRDPKFHLRLRIPKTVSPALLKKLNRLCEQKVCSHFSLETYEREIERYGGLKGCQIFEKLSASDSQLIQDLHRELGGLDLSIEERWIWCAMSLSLFYLRAFALSQEDLLQIRDNLKRKPRPPTLHKNAKTTLAQIRSLYLGAQNRKPPIVGLIEKSFQRTKSRQTSLISILRKEFSRDRIGVSLASYALSFLHVSLVRMDFESAQALEDMVLLDACEIILRKGETE
jgi:thiopeptide-type bacteriocin biosynthesis protein